MSVWILETISENDGGYLPDSRRIQGVFSSQVLAEEQAKKQQLTHTEYDITEYEIDEDDT